MKKWLSFVEIVKFDIEQINKALYSCILQTPNQKDNEIIVIATSSIEKELSNFIDQYFNKLCEIKIIYITGESFLSALIKEVKKINSKFFSILPWGQLFYPDMAVLISRIEDEGLLFGVGQYVSSTLKKDEYIESKEKSQYTDYDAKFKILFDEDFIESQFVFSKKLLNSVTFDIELGEFYFYKFIIDLITEFDYYFFNFPICEKIENLSIKKNEENRPKAVEHLYNKNLNLKGKEIHKIHSIWDNYYRNLNG